MSQQKHLSDMQRIANAFHFTEQDLMLNRERKLSEAQLKRTWRRYWIALTLLIIIFGLGSVFLAFFLWGTAPKGTFTSLPPGTSGGDGTDNEQLFFFAQIFGALFVVIMILAIIGMIGFAINIQRGELHIYRGMIQVEKGYDDNRLKLIDAVRGFDINEAQYDVLNPLVDQRPFAVYYLKTREGIVSLEPM